MAKPSKSTLEVSVEDESAIVFRRRLRIAAVVAVIVVIFLYLFGQVLLPFVVGMALAYFLDPIADRLERLGLSRTLATCVILIAFVLVLGVALVVLIPVLAHQLADFADNVPGYLTRLQQLVTSFDPEWIERRFGVNLNDLRDSLSSVLTSGLGFTTTLFSSLWKSGMALFSVAGLFVVAPVVAFYMLLDWDRMVAKVDSWVPRDHVMTVRSLARQIDLAIAGFVRGQGTLCLILGAYYAVGLTLVGLNFGILIGFFAGVISFVPYVGSIVGLVLALIVAFVQFWPDWPWVVATACVFFTGQFIEGNILQPKLVGKSVGLHPVWLMFALVAFGALFGFVGLLIAVPAAAAIGVIVRFALDRYLETPFYQGRQAEIAGIAKPLVIEVKASAPVQDAPMTPATAPGTPPQRLGS